MRLYPNITVIFIVWFLAILFIAFAAFNLLPNSGRFEDDFLKSVANWDGGHYLGIAQFGYSEKFQYAFFPLYPILIKYLTLITQNYLASGILISIICSFLGLHVLYKLLSADFEKKIAEKAILFLLFFPTSFYFLTVYSEGLFFLLVVSSFYFLRQQKLFWAIIFASLASATRLTGLAVVLALLVDIQLRAGFNRKNWFVLFSPLGLILYCVFLYNRVGDPFYFIFAENHWLRYLSLPVVPFWETIRSLSTPGFITTNFMPFLDLVFAILGVGFAARAFRFLPPFYSVYGILAVGIPLFSPSLSSMPRFLLVVFPIFLLLGLIKNEQSSPTGKYFILIYQLISLMLLALFVALFVNGYWVS